MDNQHSNLCQIRASAGSGKTYTLTSNFLSFLHHALETSSYSDAKKRNAYSWTNILAITFTNRSASEMQERIISRLKDIALASPSTTTQGLTKKQAYQWVTTFIKDYSALNIRTIDSLLHSLVRLAALDLSLPPDFTPVFDTEDALSPLLDSLLEETRHDQEDLSKILYDACNNLFSFTHHKGFMMGETLRKTIITLTHSLLNTTEQLSTPKNINKTLKGYITTVQILSKELIECITHEQLQITKNFSKALEGCTLVSSMNIPLTSVTLTKHTLHDNLLKSSPEESLNAEKLYKSLYIAVKILNTNGVLLKDALKLAPYIPLAQKLQEKLPAFLRDHGKIPAFIIPTLAKNALYGTYGIPSVVCKLGARLHHILIDEFQDTSREQWGAIQPLVVEALSNGGSFTWVGDVKQAIYNWRNGDASLFDEVLQDPEIREIVPVPQKKILTANWRSKRIIVETNNAIFSQLAQKDVLKMLLTSMLPSNTDPVILSNLFAEYLDSISQYFADSTQTYPSGTTDGYIHIQKIQAENTDALDPIVQQHLLTQIQEISTRRPLRDITILVRNKNEATKAATWITNAGISVVTENSFLLAEHPLIIQLVALLEFLENPRNDLAFWTVIKGGELIEPLFKLSCHELNEWLCTRSTTRPLYAQFKDDFPELWTLWLGSLYADAGLLSPYDAIQEAVKKLHLEQRFYAEITYIQHFLEVIYRAGCQGYGSISTFLTHWKKYGSSEKAPMPERVDAIQIMTIHKAKGLQFPVVIIPWHTFLLQENPNTLAPSELTCTRIDDLNIIVKQSSALGKSYYVHKIKKIHEALNVMYVAWTRAEDELYVILSSTKKSSFINALMPLFDHFTWNNDKYIAGTLPYSTHKDEKSHQIQSIQPKQHLHEPITTNESWRPMHWLPQLRIFRNPLKEFLFEGKSRGSLIHSCMQYVKISGASFQEDAARAVHYGLKYFPLPLPAHQYQTIEKELTSLIVWYLMHPQTSHWIRFGMPEQSILDKDNTVCRADLVVNDGSSFSVIEYKTGEPSTIHKKQIQKYIESISINTPLDVKGYLVYFDKKEIMQVHG